MSRVNFPTTFPRDPELFSFSGALLVARMTRKGRGKKTNQRARLPRVQGTAENEGEIVTLERINLSEEVYPCERGEEEGEGGRSADRKSAAGWRKLKMVARKKGRKEGSGYIDDVRLRG